MLLAPYSRNLRTSWVTAPAPRPSSLLRVFAFPYAGAGASVFSSWSRLLPADVELCGVQMPGREGRLGEPLLTRWEHAIPRLAEGLIPEMDRPFVFFGHSLGAALAFELTRHLRREGRPLPVHLFVSGRRAPHLAREKPPTYDLPQAQFLRELTRWGTPVEVLKNPEMLEVFLPLLRADFGLSELHGYDPEPPLAIPISAYGGEQDEHVSAAQVDGWREHSSAGFRRVMFRGGHFFLNEYRASLLYEFVKELQTITTRLVRAL